MWWSNACACDTCMQIIITLVLFITANNERCQRMTKQCERNAVFCSPFMFLFRHSLAVYVVNNRIKTQITTYLKMKHSTEQCWPAKRWGDRSPLSMKSPSQTLLAGSVRWKVFRYFAATLTWAPNLFVAVMNSKWSSCRFCCVVGSQTIQ